MLGMGDDSVLVGRDGRMFYLGEEAVRQSAGLVLRDQRVADAVDLIAAMQDDLARRGDPLPRRLAAERRDRLSGRSAGLGAEPGQADRIRSLSRRARRARASRRSTCGRSWPRRDPAGPAYFRHDSHWTARGALDGL